MQEPEPFCPEFEGEVVHACRVAAGPRKAGDETKFDRVIANAEDDRNRVGRCFGRTCCASAGRRGDHGYLPADQVGCQFRQQIVLILRPAVLDRHVLALDIASFLQTLAKSRDELRSCRGRAKVEKLDHRHRRLLCARRQRPCRSSAAEQRDELTASHVSTLAHHWMGWMGYCASQQDWQPDFRSGSKAAA
jgi:hypothetical protein